MNIETLKHRLRSEYTKYIIPMVKKCECEICKSKENLIVHHEYAFAKQLEDILDELDLKKDEFSEKEVEIIKMMMLGSQIKYRNVTLCKDCHTKIHSENGGFACVTDNYKNYYKNKEEMKKVEEKLKSINLKPYLLKLLNKRLYKEDQKELIDKLNIRDGSRHLQKSISIINAYLIENFDISAISKRVKENGKLKTVWILSNNEEDLEFDYSNIQF